MPEKNGNAPYGRDVLRYLFDEAREHGTSGFIKNSRLSAERKEPVFFLIGHEEVCGTEGELREQLTTMIAGVHTSEVGEQG
ncbi:hypothetical protein CCP3SC15_210028 [Gammaproteobacteria bacterium]